MFDHQITKPFSKGNPIAGRNRKRHVFSITYNDKVFNCVVKLAQIFQTEDITPLIEMNIVEEKQKNLEILKAE